MSSTEIHLRTWEGVRRSGREGAACLQREPIYTKFSPTLTTTAESSYGQAGGQRPTDAQRPSFRRRSGVCFDQYKKAAFMLSKEPTGGEKYHSGRQGL